MIEIIYPAIVFIPWEEINTSSLHLIDKEIDLKLPVYQASIPSQVPLSESDKFHIFESDGSFELLPHVIMEKRNESSLPMIVFGPAKVLLSILAQLKFQPFGSQPISPCLMYYANDKNFNLKKSFYLQYSESKGLFTKEQGVYWN